MRKPDFSGRAQRFFRNLGPGLITGAADDDPSGISTYSVAGAMFGVQVLWTALVSFPLMTAVQVMCGKLGLVTGLGLAGAIRAYYPKWLAWMACVLLLLANVVNIAADLGGMADATAMLTGVRAKFWLVGYSVLILVLLVFASYRSIVKVFKWLTLALLAYIAAAFLARPDWGEVISHTLFPRIVWNGAYWSVLVGVFGTTISPYLFFWQAAQEVEEDVAKGRVTLKQRRGATVAELKEMRSDIASGMLFSTTIMYFILLTAATTLHARGITTINSARQAAEALRPIAGDAAFLLFSFGLIGAGMLGVPVLAGSCAYAISEAVGWSGSLNDKPKRAVGFYSVIAVAMTVGLILDFFGFDAVKMLFWAAVWNGLLSPPLLVLVVLLTGRKDVMGEHRNGVVLKTLGWMSAGLMTFAGIAMFVTR